MLLTSGFAPGGARRHGRAGARPVEAAAANLPFRPPRRGENDRKRPLEAPKTTSALPTGTLKRQQVGKRKKKTSSLAIARLSSAYPPVKCCATPYRRARPLTGYVRSLTSGSASTTSSNRTYDLTRPAILVTTGSASLPSKKQ